MGVMRAAFALAFLVVSLGPGRAASAAGAAEAGAAEVTEPRVELVTMGTGPMLFHRYGHAALCVVYARAAALGRTRCFNYGTTDFGSPPQELGWRFLRGTARFWVDTQDYRQMLRIYRHHDRSVWIQRLPLGQTQVNRLVERLENDLKEENRYYTYHHFDDNCSTRLRDHLNAVTGGALRAGGDKSIGVTFRELGRRGIADQAQLIVISHFVMGRRLDRQVTVWESMFHPDYLRRQVHRRLGARPVQVYRRQGKALPTAGGYGFGWLVLLALLLALPVAATRQWGRLERVALGVVAVALTLLAVAIWLIAAVTTVPELRVNEALLVFLPSDLLLVVLGARRRQWYVRIRLAGLTLVALLLAVGALVQPLWAALLLVALPCLATARRHLPDAPTPRPSSDP
jgi:hypothetical protein